MVAPIRTALLLAISGALLAQASPNFAAAGGVPEANNRFAPKIFSLAAENGNAILSPFSIGAVMAMTAEGARGATRTQILSSLEIPDALPFGREYSTLLGRLASADPKLRIANALVLTGGTPDPEYLEIVRRDYEGEIFPGGLAEINGWVSSKTDGKIPKILDALNPYSFCVLLNAIYFKGDWLVPFDAGKTTTRTFYLSGGRETRVPMMATEEEFRFVKGDGYSAVAMPYRGGRVSMVILLPDERDGLDRIRKGAGDGDFTGALVGAVLKAPPTMLGLLLPKFKFESEFDLVEDFQRLGVREAFMDKSDFSGITPDKTLAISQIKHRALVEVDETGTEAAAATAVELMEVTGMPGLKPDIPEFRADHPFIFFIVDEDAGPILFMGQVANPAS